MKEKALSLLEKRPLLLGFTHSQAVFIIRKGSDMISVIADVTQNFAEVVSHKLISFVEYRGGTFYFFERSIPQPNGSITPIDRPLLDRYVFGGRTAFYQYYLKYVQEFDQDEALMEWIEKRLLKMELS